MSKLWCQYNFQSYLECHGTASSSTVKIAPAFAPSKLMKQTSSLTTVNYTTKNYWICCIYSSYIYFSLGAMISLTQTHLYSEIISFWNEFIMNYVFQHILPLFSLTWNMLQLCKTSNFTFKYWSLVYCWEWMNHMQLFLQGVHPALSEIKLHGKWRCFVTIKAPISVHLEEFGFITLVSGEW